jgi:hypothetical protein
MDLFQTCPIMNGKTQDGHQCCYRPDYEYFCRHLNLALMPLSILCLITAITCGADGQPKN